MEERQFLNDALELTGKKYLNLTNSSGPFFGNINFQCLNEPERCFSGVLKMFTTNNRMPEISLSHSQRTRGDPPPTLLRNSACGVYVKERICGMRILGVDRQFSISKSIRSKTFLFLGGPRLMGGPPPFWGLTEAQLMSQFAFLLIQTTIDGP